MPNATRTVASLVSVVALAILPLGVAGCGERNGDTAAKASPTDAATSPQAGASEGWERVLFQRIAGDAPVKEYLGVHELGSRLRVAWDLSGPEDPPVTLTLRIINATTGTGYGQSVSPQSDPDSFERRDDAAIEITLIPGEYRIFFSQRFQSAKGPGYDVELTLYTMP